MQQWRPDHQDRVVHANAESIIDVLYHKILPINDVTVFVRNDCSLRFVLAGDATRSMPTVSTDNLDTQPVEIMDALVPPLQPQVKSPEHSAEAKRQAFQEKAEAKHKEPKRVATPQMKPQEMTEKIPEKPDEFTQSDEARVYHALNFHVV